MTDLWFGTSGPHDAEVVLIGESWGSEEAKEQRPFVGSSGAELNRILSTAGVNRHALLCTNLIAAQPPQNETWRFFEPKIFKPGRVRGLAPGDQARPEISRLYNQLAAFPRRLVIVVGNWPLWSLHSGCGAATISESNNRKVPIDQQTWGPTGITLWRSSMLYCDPIGDFVSAEDGAALRKIPLLPILHPAAIMRQWSWREPTIHDLKKRVPLALKGDWRPNPPPVVLAPPTFPEAKARLRLWLSMADRAPFRLVSDIETYRSLMTCIGFADSTNFAMTIPFVRKCPTGLESWWKPDQEAELLSLLRRLFRHPNILIEGQNFIYDTQYIQHWLGVTPNLNFDTMLAQNVMFPGTPKDLGYLSSLYCHYHWYWKEDHKEWDSKGTVEQLLQYNSMDCLRTWEIAEAQRALLVHLRMEPQMALKMQTNALCLRMMNRGVLIDKQRRNHLVSELQAETAKLHEELLAIVPQDWIQERKKKDDTWWFNSDKQTKTLFHDLLGFRVISHRKTGNPTSGKEALVQFKKWYPEFTGLLNRLDLLGSVDNTAHVLRTPLDPDDRMRCSYNPGGAKTHRLSSSKSAFGRGTNLQNLTTGEEDD